MAGPRPGAVQVHRFDSLRALAGAVVVPGAATVPLLAPLSPGPPIRSAVIAAIAATVTVALWWWTVVRPVMLWNDGGVTILDHWGRRHSYRWPEVDRIEARLGYVRVTAGGDHASITSGGDFIDDRWGIVAAGTLSQSLEDAMARHRPGIEPPEPTPHPRARIAMPLAVAIVAVFAYSIIQR